MRQLSRRALVVISVTMITALVIFQTLSGQTSVSPVISAATNGAVRGVSGDLWADKVLGKRDFGEYAPHETVAYKLFNAGGVVVDRNFNNNNGFAYIWDSGNNRVLGVNLDTCYANAATCAGTIVFGQESLTDRNGCNRDASGQFAPNHSPAAANTLCGGNDLTITPLEEKTFSNMAVDAAGNLYVADYHNNRVLKYRTPTTTDTVADEVWGQANFRDNSCNRGSLNSPTNNSLCFVTPSTTSAAVSLSLDQNNNLWVNDNLNNRVLRFPFNVGTGTQDKTADLVLGQADFTSNSWGNGADELDQPQTITIDNLGNAYVFDGTNDRLQKFSAPISTGMSATTLTTDIDGATAVTWDPANRGLWVVDYLNNSQATIRLMDSVSGTALETEVIGHRVGGSVGIDKGNDMLFPYSGYGQNLVRFNNTSGNNYVYQADYFNSSIQYNAVSTKRFGHGTFAGVTTVGTQLLAADGRLMFWNNYVNTSTGLPNVVNGAEPSGFVGGSSFQGITQLRTDNSQRVWVLRNNNVDIYNSPLTSSSVPITTLTNVFQTLGNVGTINVINALDIAPTPDGNFLWIAEPGNHRVFRVRGPLTANPVVDIVLGQTAIANNAYGDNGFDPIYNDPVNIPNMCNRGNQPRQGSTPGTQPELDRLCFPQNVSLDRKGNLFVSDHGLEVAGNWRMLMFQSSQFPTNNASIIFSPFAVKSFSDRGFSANLSIDNYIGEDYSNGKLAVAFDSSNRMVVGGNPYLGEHFVHIFQDPTAVSTTNRNNPNYSHPTLTLEDYIAWPTAVHFDRYNNLFIFDGVRGKLLIFNKPNLKRPGAVSCGNLDADRNNTVTAYDISQLNRYLGKSCSDIPAASTCGPRDANGDGLIDATDVANANSRLNQPGCQSV